MIEYHVPKVAKFPKFPDFPKILVRRIWISNLFSPDSGNLPTKIQPRFLGKHGNVEESLGNLGNPICNCNVQDCDAAQLLRGNMSLIV